MIQHKKFAYLIFILTFILAGCGSKYKMCPLKHVKRSKADCVQRKSDVEVRVQQLSQQKLSKYSSGQRNCSYIVPLLMTIKNSSDGIIFIDKKNIDLKQVSAEEIAYHLSKSQVVAPLLINAALVPVALAGGLVGVLWAGSLGISSTYAVGVAAGLTGLIAAPFLIANKFNNSKKEFNKELLRDLNQKTVSRHYIEPYKKESVLLFVRRKDLPESFNMTLLKGEEKVPFALSLKNN